MTFISGGTFNLGNQSGTEDVERTFSAGRVLEYKIAAIKEREEKEAKDSPEAAETSSGMRQIDLLVEEFKKNQERRSRMRDSASGKNNTSHDTSAKPKSSQFPTATNLRLGNLDSRVTPSMVMAEFSCYGPILSTKVMVPRPDDTKGGRDGTCGFVLFAHRFDAEKAKKERDGSMFYGNPLVIDWASAPDPHSLAKMTKQFQGSLQTSLLPSNKASSSSRPSLPRGSEVVYIVPPQEGRIFIDSFALLVSERGPETEHRVKSTESHNPAFTFLLDERSSDYLYYHWRLESLRRGDSMERWSENPLKFGEIFLIPPSTTSRLTANTDYNKSPMDMVPIHLSSQGEPMDDQERDEFEGILRSLTASRQSIKTAMEWAIDHENCAPEIVQILSESLIISETKLATKLARLFLVSDILSNSKKLNFAAPTDFNKLFLFSSCFYSTLPQIMVAFGDKLKSIPGRITAQSLKDHIHKILLHWRKSSIYMPSFIDSLIHNFNHAELAPSTSQTSQENPIQGSTPNSRAVSQPHAPSSSHGPSEDVEGVIVTHYGGLPIDFVTLVDQEVTRLKSKLRSGTPLDELLPVSSLKRAKT
jgi:U2-associated protein SR140